MPAEVVFECGCLDSLADRTRHIGKRPLIVTGRNSARVNGALDRVAAQFPDAPVFDAVEQNPSTDTCDAGGEVCREHNCNFVVGIGGGSPMDAAKTIAVLACNPGPAEHYFGKDKFANPNLPIVAVPTTAGTGSEVTPNAVITHRAKKFKRSIAGATMFPRLALLDPTLTTTMPSDITAYTGIDALSHAMEGMISLNSTPMGEALGVDVCRQTWAWLPRAAAKPQDIEARGWMLYAAMLSGCIIAQSGTTLVHGMGYQLTLEFGLPHGLANALLLIPLFRRNAEHDPTIVAAIATALGQFAYPTPGDAALKITEVLQELFGKIGIPETGEEVGIDPAKLDELTDRIIADPSRFKNQPGTFTREDVKKVFMEAAYGSTQ